VDMLHIRLEKDVLELGSRSAEAKGLLGLIRISTAAENIADAAAQIADVVLRGVESHPIFKFVMEEAEETIVRATLSKNSILVNKTLGELGLEDNIGMRIIAVRRGTRWIYNPPDSFKLLEGDLTIARGYAEGKDRFRGLAAGTIREI